MSAIAASQLASQEELLAGLLESLRTGDEGSLRHFIARAVDSARGRLFDELPRAASAIRRSSRASIALS